MVDGVSTLVVLVELRVDVIFSVVCCVVGVSDVEMFVVGCVCPEVVDGAVSGEY